MVEVNKNVCDGCGTCVSICPHMAILMPIEGIVITESCVDCGSCVSICPVAALHIKKKK